MATLAQYGASVESMDHPPATPVHSDSDLDSDLSVFFGALDSPCERKSAALDAKLRRKKLEEKRRKKLLVSVGSDSWASEEDEGNDTLILVDAPSARPNNLYTAERLSKSFSSTSLLDQTPSPFAAPLSTPLIALGSPLQRRASKENLSPLRHQSSFPSSPLKQAFSPFYASSPSTSSSRSFNDNNHGANAEHKVWEVATPLHQASEEEHVGEINPDAALESEQDSTPVGMFGELEEASEAEPEDDSIENVSLADIPMDHESEAEESDDEVEEDEDSGDDHEDLSPTTPEVSSTHSLEGTFGTQAASDPDNVEFEEEEYDDTLRSEDESLQEESFGEGYSVDAEGESVMTEDWEAAGGYSTVPMPVLEEVTEVLSTPMVEGDFYFEEAQQPEGVLEEDWEREEDRDLPLLGSEMEPELEEGIVTTPVALQEGASEIPPIEEEPVSTEVVENVLNEDVTDEVDEDSVQGVVEEMTSEDGAPSEDVSEGPDEVDIASKDATPYSRRRTPSPSLISSPSPPSSSDSQTPPAPAIKKAQELTYAAPAPKRQLSKVQSSKIATSIIKPKDSAAELRTTGIKRPNGLVPAPTTGLPRRLPVASTTLPKRASPSAQNALKSRSAPQPSTSQLPMTRPAKIASPPLSSRTLARPLPSATLLNTTRTHPRVPIGSRDPLPERPGSAASNASNSSFASTSGARPRLPISGNVSRAPGVTSSTSRTAGGVARRVMPVQAPLKRPVSATGTATASSASTRPPPPSIRSTASVRSLRKPTVDAKSASVGSRPPPRALLHKASSSLNSSRPQSATTPAPLPPAARSRLLPPLAQTQSAPTLLVQEETPKMQSVNLVARPIGLLSRSAVAASPQPAPIVEVAPASPEKKKPRVWEAARTHVRADSEPVFSTAAPPGFAIRPRPGTSQGNFDIPVPPADLSFALTAPAEKLDAAGVVSVFPSQSAGADRRTVRGGGKKAQTPLGEVDEDLPLAPRSTRRSIGAQSEAASPASTIVESCLVCSPTTKERPTSAAPIRTSTPRPRPTYTAPPNLPHDELTKLTQANTRKNKKLFNKLNVITEHMNTVRPPSPTSSIRRSFGSEGAPGRPVTKEGREARAANRRKALRSSYEGSEPAPGDVEDQSMESAGPVTHFRAPGDEEEYMSPVRGGKSKGRKKSSMAPKDRKLHFDRALQYVCDLGIKGPCEPTLDEVDAEGIVKRVPLDAFGNYTAPPARDFLQAKKEVVKVVKMVYLDDDE